MKKLMAMAAIIGIAAGAQASMVYWQFADLTSTADAFNTAQNLSGYTAYLLSASDWSTTDVATSLGKAQASIASTDWSKNSFSSPKAQFSINKTRAEGLSLATGTGDFYIIFANGSDYWASSKLEGVSILEDGSIATDYVTAKISLSNATAIKTTDMTSYAVPEPTSGMLLLIGVAGLALRRRRA